MRSTVSTFAGVASVLMAASSLVDGKPIKRDASGQAVMYWGQTDESSLATYCASGAGANIINLAFLMHYGGGQIPFGNFGSDCTINTDGTGSDGCAQLASDIQTCQAAGVKIFVSVGGAATSNPGQLSDSSDAQAIADALWNSYGNPAYGDSSAPRPFGSTYVNGFDLDIEVDPSGNGNAYYVDLVNQLRSHFSADSSNQYYISAAPSCPLPDDIFGDVVQGAAFDYLWVQFYNGDQCAAYQLVRPEGNQGQHYNYQDWANYLAQGASASAKLFIGLPAAPLAATGDISAAKNFLSPTELATVYQATVSNPIFGGIMIWDAGFSDSQTADGCTYIQEIQSLLSTGQLCGGGSGTKPPTSTPSPSPVPRR